jgi:dihydrofolate synthase/folylpolyglutamate synthase
MKNHVETLATSVINQVYQSYNAAKPYVKAGFDRDVRHPEWTGRILAELGHPDRSGYNVSVTGSKGKGSHAIILAAILRRMGLKVGLFTGPHLIDYMERLRINGQVIEESVFVTHVKRVLTVVDDIDLSGNQYVGPIGILAAAAALWFQERQTDVNVYEYGRGALHDDVNQIWHQGAVLTPVFSEHAAQLGPTVRDIAIEKLGILTPETEWLCSHPQSDVVVEVLGERANAQQTSINFLNRDFSYMRNGSEVRFETSDRSQYILKIPDWPQFIVDNAAVALDAAIRTWKGMGRPRHDMPQVIDITDLRLPGRMMHVRQEPLTIVDGTVHLESAHYIQQWIRRQVQNGRSRRVKAVFGLPADKDREGVFAQLRSVVDKAVVTKAQNPHLTFAEDTLALARRYFADAVATPDLVSAMQTIDEDANPQDLILVLGTQSFVAEALAHFGINTHTLWEEPVNHNADIEPASS